LSSKALSPLPPAAVKPQLEGTGRDFQRVPGKHLLNMSRQIDIWRADFRLGVTISTDSIPISSPSKPDDPREEMMQRTKSEAERARAQYVELAKQYRAIGPADLRAALLCTAKKRKNIATPTAKAA
jgi:hypothetical protein